MNCADCASLWSGRCRCDENLGALREFYRDVVHESFMQVMSPFVEVM